MLVSMCMYVCKHVCVYQCATQRIYNILYIYKTFQIEIIFYQLSIECGAKKLQSSLFHDFFSLLCDFFFLSFSTKTYNNNFFFFFFSLIHSKAPIRYNSPIQYGRITECPRATGLSFFSSRRKISRIFFFFRSMRLHL